MPKDIREEISAATQIQVKIYSERLSEYRIIRLPINPRSTQGLNFQYRSNEERRTETRKFRKPVPLSIIINDFKSFLSQQVTPFLLGKFGSQTDAACVILNRFRSNYKNF